MTPLAILLIMYKSVAYYRKVRKYPLHDIYMLNLFSCQKNVNKARDPILYIRNLDSTSVKQT